MEGYKDGAIRKVQRYEGKERSQIERRHLKGESKETEARGGKEERRKHTETQLGLTLPCAREVSLKIHSQKVKSSSV